MIHGENRVTHPDSDTVCTVGLDNFNVDVLAEKKPVLLLCMPRDKSFYTLLGEIEKLLPDYQHTLKMCLLEEDFLGAFMEQYNVKGTPTFLIFSAGIERERLLGQVSHERLKHFIQQSLPDI